MSNKSDKENDKKKKIVNRKVVLYPDETQNSSYINDMSKNFDCLKISILNKASRVSGEFGKVTLGPDADHTNDDDSDSINEDLSKTNNNSVNGVMSPRSHITFSIKKILLENEVQRRDQVRRTVEQKKREMERLQRSQDELSQLLAGMAITREKKRAEELALFEANEEHIAQQQEIDRKNEMQMRRLKESEEIYQRIIPYRESFIAKWTDIANITKACRDKNANHLLKPHSNKLKMMQNQMEAINEKYKKGDLTLADIKMAEMVAQHNEEFFQSFKAEIDQLEALYDQEIARREHEMKQAELAAQEEALKIKQMQDMQNSIKVPEQLAFVQQEVIYQQQHQQQQPQQQQQQQQQQRQQQPLNQNQQLSEVDYATSGFQAPQNSNIPVSTAPPTNDAPAENQTEESSDYYPDHESLQIYVNSHQLLENYTASYQDFVNNSTMKKFRFECQKSLSIAVNAVSGQSREQLVDKYEKLRLFLSGKGSPNILQNPQAEAYSKNFLAQKLVDQGDTVKLEMAFPFAALTVALWNDWPDIGELFLVRLRTKFPFFVPVFLMQRSDQSDEDYFKSLGCKYNVDGTPEKTEQFIKRLGGSMYIYAAILVTKQRRGVNKPHPHGIGNAWRWLAATLNIEPRPDIADVCATLIFNMLQVTGNELWKTYPNQFPKMLLVLNNVYYEKLKSFDPVVSAPITRLGDFLAKAIKDGSIPPPKKQLPPNFW